MPRWHTRGAAARLSESVRSPQGPQGQRALGGIWELTAGLARQVAARTVAHPRHNGWDACKDPVPPCLRGRGAPPAQDQVRLPVDQGTPARRIRIPRQGPTSHSARGPDVRPPSRREES